MKTRSSLAQKRQRMKHSEDEEGKGRVSKKKCPQVNLTKSQEEQLRDFFKSNPCFYLKSIEDYHNPVKKLRLLKEIGEVVNLDSTQIRVWFGNIRNHYAKATDIKSDKGQKTFSDREMWIVNNFGFLEDHNLHQTSRTSRELPSLMEAQIAQSPSQQNSKNLPSISADPDLDDHTLSPSEQDSGNLSSTSAGPDLEAQSSSPSQQDSENLPSTSAEPDLEPRRMPTVLTSAQRHGMRRETALIRKQLADAMITTAQSISSIKSHLATNLCDNSALKTPVEEQMQDFFSFLARRIGMLSQDDWDKLAGKLDKIVQETLLVIKYRRRLHSHILLPSHAIAQPAQLHEYHQQVPHPPPSSSQQTDPSHIFAGSPPLLMPQPAVVQPTQPTQPAVIQPTQPAVMQATQPAVVQPTQPAVMQSTQPAVVQPTQPAIVQATQPAVVQPTQPQEYHQQGPHQPSNPCPETDPLYILEQPTQPQEYHQQGPHQPSSPFQETDPLYILEQPTQPQEYHQQGPHQPSSPCQETDPLDIFEWTPHSSASDHDHNYYINCPPD